MNTYIKERREEGFTLIELLIAIVVVGILTAVVIVGIGGLTDQGKKGSCQASLDASKTAVAVHYNNQTPHAYPTTFTQMVTAKELDLSQGVVDGGATISTGDWSIALGAGGALTPTGPGGTAGSCA